MTRLAAVPTQAMTADQALCYALQTHLCYSNISPDALAFRVLRQRLDATRWTLAERDALATFREALRWRGTLRRNFAARVGLAFDKDHAARASDMLDWAIDEVFAALLAPAEARR